MRIIKLRFPFRFHHAEIPAGTVVGVPADIAARLIRSNCADPAAPEHAVIEQPETRALAPAETREQTTAEPNRYIKRGRGRPKKEIQAAGI